MSNTLDEKMKEVGFNEHERLLIARLYKPVITEARIDELNHMKFIDPRTGEETFAPYLQYRCTKDELLVDWDYRQNQLLKENN